MKNRFALIVGALVLGACAMTSLARAQVELSSGVARISLIHGDVSTQRGDSGDWATAALNQPMVSSDQVSTGVSSRSEVQLDSRNILRLGDNTLAKIAGLTRTQIQIQVERGLIDYTVFKGTEAEVEIDTANVAVRPAQKDGIYRIEVNAQGETQVIVRKGAAEISTPQGSTQVEKGQMAIVRGVGAETVYKLSEATAKDSWDSWNSDRDRTIHDAQSWGNTNRYYTGSEDLDAYGRWETVPDYGPVWAPAVGPGWAPYRRGRWVWEPGWGWTWVSYEPWGWAPYHYGRWFVYNSAWVWWPGPARGFPRYRPVWAPAYVSFFGFGRGVGFGVGFGFGSVGWLPIGPCDPFFPWYGRFGSRFNVVNITNIYNFHNGPGRRFGGFAPLRRGDRYSNLRLATLNDRVRGGISTVPTGQFGTGRSVPVAVNGETFRGGRMIAGNLPVVPTRAALSVSNRPAATSTLPRGGEQQRFFSKARPAAAPQSFDRQVAQMQQSIQRNGGGTRQSFSRGESAVQNRSQVQAQNPGRGTLPTPNAEVGKGATSEGSGWRRFSGSSPAQRDGPLSRSSESAARPNVPRPENSSRPDASSNDGGWRHFTPQSGGGPTNRMNSGGATDRVNNRDGMSGMSGMNSARGSGPDFQRGPDREVGGWRNGGSASPQDSRPPLEMRQPIVTPRGSEGRGSAPRESAPSRGGAGGGGSHGGSGGGPHGRSGRR